MYTLKQKLKAFSDELDVNVSDIEVDDSYKGGVYVKITGGDHEGEEYTIYTGNEADDALRDDIENIMDDLGLDSFTEDFRQWILENAVDKSWFDEWLSEDVYNQIYDLRNEDSDEYIDGFIEELHNLDLISDDELEENEDMRLEPKENISEDDLEQRYVDYRSDEDSLELYIDTYGLDEVSRMVAEDPSRFIDLDAVRDEIKDWDGYISLSRYDGQTIDLDMDLYAFRQD